MPIIADASFLSSLEVLEKDDLIKIIKGMRTGGIAVLLLHYMQALCNYDPDPDKYQLLETLFQKKQIAKYANCKFWQARRKSLTETVNEVEQDTDSVVRNYLTTA
jgi:hypothetical protein